MTLDNTVLINAMHSCIEGYVELITDSIEFELKRPLTSEETQEVCHRVENMLARCTADRPATGSAFVAGQDDGGVKPELFSEAAAPFIISHHLANNGHTLFYGKARQRCHAVAGSLRKGTK